MDENINTQNLEKEIEARPDKETSRTFTQSEVDQMIAKAAQRTKQNFSDYETIKTEYETLKAQQKEKEMAEKTEVEKLQAMLSESTTELTNVKTQYTELSRKQLRNDVLNGNKYLGLPRAYKKLVSLSDNKDEIIASADEVLEEFKKDTGKEVAATFGIPEPQDTTLSEPAKEVKDPADLAAALRSKIMSKIKMSGRG
jgi:predicted nuclease with TOPRIM domain